MRRVLGGLLVVAASLAAVAGLVLVLQSRDEAEVGGGGPGEKVEDHCPGRPQPVTRDRRRLSDAQVQTALAEGNVVIRYVGRPPRELRRLQRDVTGGGFDAEIAAAGQMVILAEAGAVDGVEARAWGRRLVVQSPQDPRLRAFAEAWLGNGAPEPCA